MGTCASKEAGPVSADPHCTPLGVAHAPFHRSPSAAAGLSSGAVSAVAQTRKAISSTLGQRYIHNALEASAVLFDELAHHVPLIGPVCKALAVVCTVALNAASQPEYARRHAIKICAYREFLEPLQETHAGEDGDYKASKALRSALVTFAGSLDHFGQALNKLIHAKNLDRVRTSLSADPLKNEWAALEEASVQLQRALGLETCANIKLLLAGQRDVQMQLALISAHLIGQKKGPGGAVSSDLGPVIGNGDEGLQVNMVAIELGLWQALPSPTSPAGTGPSVVSASALLSSPMSDGEANLGNEGEPHVLQPGDEAPSSNTDPFLEELVANYVTRHMADKAEKKRLQAEVKEARDAMSQLTARTQAQEKELKLLKMQLPELIAASAAKDKKLRVTDEALSQQQQLVTYLREELAKRDAQVQPRGSGSDCSDEDVQRFFREMIPILPLLPPVAVAPMLTLPPSSSAAPTSPPVCEKDSHEGQALRMACIHCRSGLCDSCVEEHPKVAPHQIVTVKTFATQLRQEVQKDGVFAQAEHELVLYQERAQAWHQQAVGAQTQANELQTRIQEEALNHVASNVASVLAEVKRVNDVMQNFVATLHGKATTYIERGLQREEKQHRLRTSHHRALQTTQTTAAQSDAVVACHLPSTLTQLEAAQQVAIKEELDLRGLPLDSLSMGLAVVGKFNTVLSSISEVFDAPAEDPPGAHVRTIGKEGSDDGEFQRPAGVAVSGGLLYVADSGNHRVQVLNAATHEHVRTIGEKGRGDEQFMFPSGVAVSGGLLYVADSGNHRVQVLNAATYEHVRTIGEQGSSNGEFMFPSGVAVSGGLLYVADGGNHRVQVLNAATHEHVRTIGQEGSDNGEFKSPHGVAVSGDLLYVADFLNSRVQVFNTATFEHVRTVGKEGSGNGEFNCLCHVAVSGGLLYVADSNHRVQVFNAATYEHLRTIGKEGSGNGEFKSSQGVAVSGGLLYVADCGNHRVQILRA